MVSSVALRKAKLRPPVAFAWFGLQVSLPLTVMLYTLHMSFCQHGAIAIHANAAAFRRGALTLQATTACREIERVCDDARRSWRTRESETGSKNRTSCSDPDRTGLPLKIRPDAGGPFVYLMRRILTGPWAARCPV
jgi:hypothetical protein